MKAECCHSEWLRAWHQATPALAAYRCCLRCWPAKGWRGQTVLAAAGWRYLGDGHDEGGAAPGVVGGGGGASGEQQPGTPEAARPGGSVQGGVAQAVGEGGVSSQLEQGPGACFRPGGGGRKHKGSRSGAGVLCVDISPALHVHMRV